MGKSDSRGTSVCDEFSRTKSTYESPNFAYVLNELLTDRTHTELKELGPLLSVWGRGREPKGKCVSSSQSRHVGVKASEVEE